MNLPQFKILDNGPDQLSSVEITEGIYKGLIYKYGEVDFSSETTLSFMVEVVQSPYPGYDPLASEAKQVLGDILVSLITESAQRVLDDHERRD